MEMGKINLRPHQIEPASKAVSFFREKKPVPSILIAPTAFGKSFLIAKILEELEGESVLVLQPSIELLKQNREKYSLTGNHSEVYSASFGSKEIGEVTFATIGSIYKIGSQFRHFTKMIIDECHLYPRNTDSMLGKFLKDSGITHVLGLTATPFKLQTNSDINGYSYSKLVMLTNRNKFAPFFKKIISISQIEEIVRLGFWSKMEYYEYETNSKYLVLNSTGSDYTEKSMDRYYEKNGLRDKIAHIVTKSKRKSILVFVTSVDEAEYLAGITPSAAYVCGDTPTKERDSIINGFKRLDIRVVFNVNVLSVGFDHPQLDCIIMARPTASCAWYYQALGRLTRIHEDKERSIVVDLSGNVRKFGKIEGFHFKPAKNGWQMYRDDGSLITGIPLTEIGLHK